ncbi:MAG: beta-galactosidase [Dehalococcoidia bacterium]
MAFRLRSLPPFGPIYLLPVALLLTGIRVAWGSSWYRTAPLGSPIYGVDFSCRQAQWLGEDCHQAYTAILEQLHVRHIRLSAYWDQIEAQAGVYDFSELDWQIDEAARHGTAVTLSVGMKAQRAPEYYLPDWVRAGQHIPEGASPAANPAIAAATLDFVRATVQHEAGKAAIETWQVENEPFVHFWHTAHDWSLPEWFVQQEAAAIRASDPQGRPLLITHASWLRTDGTLRQILKTADIVGEAVYTKRQRGLFAGIYLYPFELGPLTPDLPRQARTAERQGKELWISELQAEPFEANWVTVKTPDAQTFPSISPELLESNLRLAERSGATRVYLWGAEWWYYQLHTHNDPSLWNIAQRTLIDSEAREIAHPPSRPVLQLPDGSRQPPTAPSR